FGRSAFSRFIASTASSMSCSINSARPSPKWTCRGQSESMVFWLTLTPRCRSRGGSLLDTLSLLLLRDGLREKLLVADESVQFATLPLAFRDCALRLRDALCSADQRRDRRVLGGRGVGLLVQRAGPDGDRVGLLPGVGAVGADALADRESCGDHIAPRGRID